MNHVIRLLPFLLLGCTHQQPPISNKTATPPPLLVVGGCYYYHRPGGGGLLAERVNPFFYRVSGRAGQNLVMDAYTTGEHVGRLLQNEKRLARYSAGVSCAVLDSLSKK